MAIWEAIQYVGSGLGLVAFVAAATFMAYRARLKHRAQIIENAPAKQRLEAIAATAQLFRVDTTALKTSEQKDIVLAQISTRAKRDLIYALVAVSLGLMLSAIAVFSIIYPEDDRTEKPTQDPSASASNALAEQPNQAEEQLPQIEPKAIPPGRIIIASPFRARLDYCPESTCDFEMILRGYDEQGNLRFDNSQQFTQIPRGAYVDTTLQTRDALYMEVNQQLVRNRELEFELYCRYHGSVIVGDTTSINWTEFHEGGDVPGYATWLSCRNTTFQASLGIGVGIAANRRREPPVRQDPGPPR